LSFGEEHTDPTTGQVTFEPAFASRGRVGQLLSEEFTILGLTTTARNFVLEGLGKEEEGRSQWMELKVVVPIDKHGLEEAQKRLAELRAKDPGSLTPEEAQAKDRLEAVFKDAPGQEVDASALRPGS